MLSATAAIGLFDGLRFLILIFELLDTIFPFHLLGLNGLIGVIASLPELRDSIGPLTDKLYAVLPAGVDTNNPSPVNFFIITFFSTFKLKDAVCLLCLNKEISLIAIKFFFLLLLRLVISSGLIVAFFAFYQLILFLEAFHT